MGLEVHHQKRLIPGGLRRNETWGSAGTNRTSIYAMVMRWQLGICGIYPAHLGGLQAVVLQIGGSGTDDEIHRVTVSCGLVLFSDALSLARLGGIAT